MIRYILIMLFIINKLSSQSVAGRISDSLNVPIAYSPVALLNAKDSTIYKGTITDEQGAYYFQKINPGNYLLKFSIPGLEEKLGSSFQLDSNDKFDAGTTHLKNLKGIDLDEIS